MYIYIYVYIPTLYCDCKFQNSSSLLRMQLSEFQILQSTSKTKLVTLKLVSESEIGTLKVTSKSKIQYNETQYNTISPPNPMPRQQGVGWVGIFGILYCIVLVKYDNFINLLPLLDFFKSSNIHTNTFHASNRPIRPYRTKNQGLTGFGRVRDFAVFYSL